MYSTSGQDGVRRTGTAAHQISDQDLESLLPPLDQSAFEEEEEARLALFTKALQSRRARDIVLPESRDIPYSSPPPPLSSDPETSYFPSLYHVPRFFHRSSSYSSSSPGSVISYAPSSPSADIISSSPLGPPLGPITPVESPPREISFSSSAPAKLNSVAPPPPSPSPPHTIPSIANTWKDPIFELIEVPLSNFLKVKRGDYAF